jgi:hypothetical protein
MSKSEPGTIDIARGHTHTPAVESSSPNNVTSHGPRSGVMALRGEAPLTPAPAVELEAAVPPCIVPAAADAANRSILSGKQITQNDLWDEECREHNTRHADPTYANVRGFVGS